MTQKQAIKRLAKWLDIDTVGARAFYLDLVAGNLRAILSHIDQPDPFPCVDTALDLAHALIDSLDVYK